MEWSMVDQQRLTGLLWLAKWFLLLTLFVLIVDIFCVFVLWSPNGARHLESVFQQEVALLKLQPAQEAFLVNVTRAFYAHVFVSTGIDGALRQSTNPGTESPQTAHDFANALWPVLETAMIGLKLFALRIGVLILTLPFLALITAVAIADGFVGWYLRRTGGERESGFIYHRAKRGLAWSFLLLWIVYLIPLVPMDPRYLLPPFLLASGIATRLHVAFFKKYL
jgi:integrating conjugative element membrane protein (TIGR03747 family)